MWQHFKIEELKTIIHSPLLNNNSSDYSVEKNGRDIKKLSINILDSIFYSITRLCNTIIRLVHFFFDIQYFQVRLDVLDSLNLLHLHYHYSFLQ